MSSTTDPILNTQNAVRPLLAGNPPNGIAASDCSHPDYVSELYRAHKEGGIEAVRRVTEALSKRDPGFAQIVSGNDLKPETPPALDSENAWLPEKTITEALSKGETGDAELLAKLYDNRLAYDHTEKQWYLWNGYHWEADTRKQVGNLVAYNVAAQYIHAAAKLKQRAAGDDEKAQGKLKELWQRANSLRSRNKISNVLDLASKQPTLALAGIEWEADPMLLAVANGVIDLTTGEFRAGRPRDYIRTASPVTWRGLSVSAPRWEQFLLEVFADDEELISFVQRLLGYAITGKVTEHRLPILWGQGRNGKETLLETIRSVLGDLAAPVPKDVLMDAGRNNVGGPTPHLYKLRPLRLAWVSESQAGARLNAEQAKWLTGGGTITARPMYGSQVEFSPKYTLMLITNHKPRADSDDYALWQRLLLIKFTQSFVSNPKAGNERKADPYLAEKLKAEEAPGILAWLVRGCLAWQSEGLNPPASVLGTTEAYHAEEDTIAPFIEECCVTTSGAEVKAGQLYMAYKEWVESYGMRPMGSRTFGEKMVKKFTRDRAKDGNGLAYYGVGLKA